MKVLLTYDFKDDNKIKKLESLGYEVIVAKEKELEINEDNKDIDVLVTVGAFDYVDIDKFENLKLIQLLTTGVNQVPKEKVINSDLILANNKLGFNIPIGEWIVLSVLQLAKQSKKFFKQQDNKEWKMDWQLSEIYNKTIGFLGTGDIAKEASKRLQGFGVNIVGINSTGNPTEYFEKTYSLDNMNEVLGSFDYLVVALPYTKDTHQLVNREFIDKLKDGVSIVNIARGTIIDEKEMIKSLESGKIASAALDVFEIEPLPADNPLWEMENVIVTPHNSWSSEVHDERRFDITYENLKRFINGEEIINIIDLERGY